MEDDKSDHNEESEEHCEGGLLAAAIGFLIGDFILTISLVHNNYNQIRGQPIILRASTRKKDASRPIHTLSASQGPSPSIVAPNCTAPDVL